MDRAEAEDLRKLAVDFGEGIFRSCSCKRQKNFATRGYFYFKTWFIILRLYRKRAKLEVLKIPRNLFQLLLVFAILNAP